jgi:hypothetical protein
MDKAVKISIITGVLIASLSVAYYLVIFLPSKGSTTTDEMSVIAQSPVVSEEPVVVEKVPSERALEAAVYFYNNISKERQEKMRATWGGGSEDSRDAMRGFAFMLDDRKETLVEVEQMIEDYKAKKGQGGTSTTYTSPSISQEISGTESLSERLKQQRTQQCQTDMAKYNSCLAEYNSKLAEYNACQTGNNDPSKMFKSYCSKPFSSCFKPICAY